MNIQVPGGLEEVVSLDPMRSTSTNTLRRIAPGHGAGTLFRNRKQDTGDALVSKNRKCDGGGEAGGEGCLCLTRSKYERLWWRSADSERGSGNFRRQ